MRVELWTCPLLPCKIGLDFQKTVFYYNHLVLALSSIVYLFITCMMICISCHKNGYICWEQLIVVYIRPYVPHCQANNWISTFQLHALNLSPVATITMHLTAQSQTCKMSCHAHVMDIIISGTGCHNQEHQDTNANTSFLHKILPEWTPSPHEIAANPWQCH